MVLYTSGAEHFDKVNTDVRPTLRLVNNYSGGADDEHEQRDNTKQWLRSKESASSRRASEAFVMSLSTSDAVACAAQTQTLISEEEHVRLMSERDAMWRAHEQSQISFLQTEHGAVLGGLHAEVERLQTANIGKTEGN